jgi:hypothetical protein
MLCGKCCEKFVSEVYFMYFLGIFDFMMMKMELRAGGIRI